MLSNKGQFFSPVLIMAGTITGAAEETTAITVSSSKISPVPTRSLLLSSVFRPPRILLLSSWSATLKSEPQ